MPGAGLWGSTKDPKEQEPDARALEIPDDLTEAIQDIHEQDSGKDFGKGYTPEQIFLALPVSIFISAVGVSLNIDIGYLKRLSASKHTMGEFAVLRSSLCCTRGSRLQDH